VILPALLDFENGRVRPAIFVYCCSMPIEPLHAVIAGLDPAIHEAMPHVHQD